jgi:NADH dehydrogenase FAD-containing subunit
MVQSTIALRELPNLELTNLAVDDAKAAPHFRREDQKTLCRRVTHLERASLLTVAVVGAGPAGIEMAVTLADLLPRWYNKLGGSSQKLRVVL